MIGANYISFKTGKWCYSMQVIVDGQGLVIWTDNGNPAGVHDYRCIWRSDLVRKIDFDQDALMADLGYQGKRLRVYFETPLPKDQIFTLADQTDSNVFHSTRVRIEHFFGVLKLRFPIFRIGYQGPASCFVTLFRLGCAFINLLRQRGQISRVEEEQGHFLQLEDESSSNDAPYDGPLDSVESRGRVRVLQTPGSQEEQQWQGSLASPISQAIVVETEPTAEVQNEDLSFELDIRSRLSSLRRRENHTTSDEQIPSGQILERGEHLLSQCQNVVQQLTTFLSESRRRPREEGINDDEMQRYRRLRRPQPQ